MAEVRTLMGGGDPLPLPVSPAGAALIAQCRGMSRFGETRCFFGTRRWRMDADEKNRFDRIVATVDGPMIVVTTASQEHVAGCLVGSHNQSSIDPRRYTLWLSRREGVAVLQRWSDFVTHQHPVRPDLR
jgi:hypothetical protein